MHDSSLILFLAYLGFDFGGENGQRKVVPKLVLRSIRSVMMKHILNSDPFNTPTPGCEKTNYNRF
jgi:hypothetical protein